MNNAPSNPPGTFTELVGLVTNLISLLVPVVIALTFLFIAWKVVSAWIINGGDKESVEEGKKVALIGVVVLVFMFGLWGLLAVLQGSLGL